MKTGKQYGFDRDGGFIVLDHDRQAAGYAYDSSTYATRAKRDPVKTAGDMLKHTYVNEYAKLTEKARRIDRLYSF